MVMSPLGSRWRGGLKVCAAAWAAAAATGIITAVDAVLIIDGVFLLTRETFIARSLAGFLTPLVESSTSAKYPMPNQRQQRKGPRQRGRQSRHHPKVLLSSSSSWPIFDCITIFFTTDTGNSTTLISSAPFRRRTNENGDNLNNDQQSNDRVEGGNGEEGAKQQQQEPGQNNVDTNDEQANGGNESNENMQEGQEGQQNQEAGGPEEENKNGVENLQDESGTSEELQDNGSGQYYGDEQQVEYGRQNNQQEQDQLQQNSESNEEQPENGYNNEQGQAGREDAGDDYFDDHLHDDIVGNHNENSDSSTTSAINQIDDYYAYIEDPGPPRLVPLTSREVLGYFLASIALTLGASGGIGGGGIVVPIYILVIGLPLRVAVTTGAVTVLGGALGSTILNWTRRHPLADRPLIDFDLVLVLEPLILVGTLIGVLCHRLLSEKFLIVLLVLLLSVTAHTTLSKAMRMYQAEKKYIRHLIAAQDEPPSGSPTNFSRFSKNGDNSTMNRSMTRLTEKQQILILNPDFVTLRSDLIEEEKFTPFFKIMALALMFSVLMFLNVMVGGGEDNYQSPWDIRCGSPAFWMMYMIMMSFLIASAWVAQTYVVARQEIKDLVNFDYVTGDIKWDARSAILYPAVFVLVGFFAGTLGIGGGVITVPTMLAMGVHPSVVSATSSSMILFTSLLSTSCYVVFGLILHDYATVGFCVGFLAAIVGQNGMRQVRKATSASGRNFERNSYVAFAIGGIVLLSALLMTVEYVLRIVQQPEVDEGGLCDGLRF